mgnify:CR=1 FL=1
MTRITLNHPVFRSAGYDAEDQTMEISFRDGSVLLFRGVPMSIYNRFMRASQRTDIDIETYYRTVIEGRFSMRQIKAARALA